MSLLSPAGAPRAAVVCAAVVFAAGLAACGDDSEAESAPETTVAAASVTVFTPDEICDLLPAADVGAALGVDIAPREPSVGGTPACSYEWTTADGVVTNVVVAILRPIEDLGGNAGAAGYRVALDTNRSFAAEDSVDEEVRGVGDGARWLSGAATSVLIAYQGDHVVSMAGGEMSQEAAALIVGRVLAAIN